jgi:UDP-N-acetylmuramoyl-tripeptide--D-alanyl-D-alanine ligase
LFRSSNEIILDAYNANPSSMKFALENFNSLVGKNKICILGDMFELGTDSAFEHDVIVQQIENYDLEKVFFIGKNFFLVKSQNAKFIFYETFDDFQKFLVLQKWSNKQILIKGSRGIALERTLEFI